jgi:hypothetical protein
MVNCIELQWLQIDSILSRTVWSNYQTLNSLRLTFLYKIIYNEFQEDLYDQQIKCLINWSKYGFDNKLCRENLKNELILTNWFVIWWWCIYTLSDSIKISPSWRSTTWYLRINAITINILSMSINSISSLKLWWLTMN